MNKNIGLIGLSILLLLSVVSLIGLYSENSELKEEITVLTTEQGNENEEIQDVTNLEEETRFIQTAFNNILNYTNETYNQRLSEAKNHFSAESYQLLQGVGNDENLRLSIQSATSNEQVYKSLQGDNQFIYVAEVSYQVEENEPVVIDYFYQFNLLEKNNEYRIDNVEIIPKQPTIY
jgi:predicted DNA binding CopG/RHH family protein